MQSLEIPAFLRREPTPEGRARADAVVRATLNGNRDWAPMRGAQQIIQEEAKRVEMAKYNQLIVDRAAPVEVFRYNAEGPPGSDPLFVRNFANMDEFEKWYRGPPVHRDLGARSTKEMTTMLLDIQGDPNVAPKSSPITKPGFMKKVGGAPVAKSDKPYIVNSHVGMILRATGFIRKSTPDGEPLTFSRGDDECVIVPPAPDKKSSSAWVLKLAGKPVLEGFGASIEKELKK